MTKNTVEPEVVQIREGSPHDVKNRYGEARTVKIDREWSVRVDGEEVGRIRYRLITRERRGKGMRYVYARWQSPGWEYATPDTFYPWFERSSKKACLESIAWDARR